MCEDVKEVEMIGKKQWRLTSHQLTALYFDLWEDQSNGGNDREEEKERERKREIKRQ